MIALFLCVVFVAGGFAQHTIEPPPAPAVDLYIDELRMPIERIRVANPYYEPQWCPERLAHVCNVRGHVENRWVDNFLDISITVCLGHHSSPVVFDYGTVVSCQEIDADDAVLYLQPPRVRSERDGGLWFITVSHSAPIYVSLQSGACRSVSHRKHIGRIAADTDWLAERHGFQCRVDAFDTVGYLRGTNETRAATESHQIYPFGELYDNLPFYDRIYVSFISDAFGVHGTRTALRGVLGFAILAALYASCMLAAAMSDDDGDCPDPHGLWFKPRWKRAVIARRKNK